MFKQWYYFTTDSSHSFTSLRELQNRNDSTDDTLSVAGHLSTVWHNVNFGDKPLPIWCLTFSISSRGSILQTHLSQTARQPHHWHREQSAEKGHPFWFPYQPGGDREEISQPAASEKSINFLRPVGAGCYLAYGSKRVSLEAFRSGYLAPFCKWIRLLWEPLQFGKRSLRKRNNGPPFTPFFFRPAALKEKHRGLPYLNPEGF